MAVENKPTLTLEWLPRFPRPFVRLPFRVRLTPDRGYWVGGIGRVRIEWSATGTR